MKMMTYNDMRLLGILSHIVDKDESHRRYYQKYDSADIDALEEAGWIEIQRPHFVGDDDSCAPYSQQYTFLAVTQDGLDYIAERYDGGDFEEDGVTPLVF